MREHWLRFIRDSEKRTEIFLAKQVVEPDSRDFGAVTASWGGANWGFGDPKPTLGHAATAIAVWLNPESRRYADPAIPLAVDLAFDYASRRQNEDGTFDYTPCNFRAAPDTAFIVNRSVVTLRLLERAAGDPKVAAQAAPLAAKLKGILLKAADGIAKGGFHTPNHRWAICAALSSCGNIAGDDRYQDLIKRYLAEGIDGNAEGEYAERSAGNYNMVNNDQIIILDAEGATPRQGDEPFLTYVDRNLEMMLAYLDPDRSIFTNNSTRQDRGVKTWLDNYFFNYLYTARKLDKPLFAAVAKRIMDDVIESGRLAPDFLDWIMLTWNGLDYGDTDVSIPENYEKNFVDSGIARIRHGDFSYSLLRDTGRFLYFQSGSIAAYLRLPLIYFEKREFKATSIVKEGDAYTLRFTANGWYYQPFETPPDTSDWWAMDQSARPRIDGPKLDFVVRIKERPEGDGIDVRVEASGWEGVPLRFEIGLPPNVRVESDAFLLESRADESLLVKSGDLRVSSGLDELVVGPAFAEHLDIIGGTYGKAARSRDHFSAYFTAFTPCARTISFRRVGPRAR